MRVIFRLFAVAIPLAAAVPALAQQRYPTCAQAHATVQRKGAAVIWTAPHIYDRYVANASYCMPGEYASARPSSTRDNPDCFIGYVCRQGPPSWSDF